MALSGLKAFVAAVLAGSETSPAPPRGFILGLLEIMLVALLPGLGGYKDASLFSFSLYPPI